MARRYVKPPPQQKPRAIHVNIYCDKCAKLGIQEWGNFGMSGEVHLCGGHWQLTAHYQQLKYKEFFEVLSKEDK